jgi:hypothetical protein
VRFVRDGEVNSNAQVNPIDDVYVCSGDDVYQVDFSTTNSQGTTQYYWTNDNDSTGIPLSGIGSNTLSPGGVSNTTSVPQVSTITVTPELTFQGQTTTGPSETFTVTVNPTAQVNPIADITVNSGEAVQTIMFSTFNTSGTTTYTWTNDNTSLGLASSGSGNIPYFTPNNTTTTPVVGTITVTPTFDNGALICIGPPISFTITVNPAAGGTCPPSDPGQYRIEMHDSYGDGWQTNDRNGGNGIMITIDGEVTEVAMCTVYTTSEGYINFNQADFCVVGDYYDATGYVDIPAGASDVLWEFPGDWYGEISFEIYAPDGTLIGEYGANQPAGLLILCDTDLGS